MEKHMKDCLCDYCNAYGKDGGKGLRKLYLQEQKYLKDYVFLAHYVASNSLSQQCNYHTHGLLETKNHPDLQIVLPIDPKQAHSIFWGVIYKINEGKKFTDNLVTSEIEVDDFLVKFIEVKESDRKVLRILFPDINKKLPGEEGCDPLYQRQAIVVTV